MSKPQWKQFVQLFGVKKAFLKIKTSDKTNYSNISYDMTFQL